MKPFLIFVILLMLGAMFLIGEHPEYNPFNSGAQEEVQTSTTGDVMKDAISESDKHQGEE